MHRLKLPILNHCLAYHASLQSHFALYLISSNKSSLRYFARSSRKAFHIFTQPDTQWSILGWIGKLNVNIMKQFLPHIFGNTALVKVVLAQEQKVKYPASHLVSKRSGAQGKQREIKRWGAANTNVSFEEIQITGVGQIRSEQEISPCFLPRIRFILCSRAVQ